ncbi:hypothetical protein BGX34_007313 [Mortierella sp. NVP85]|nr:hypothetical protein BGX34_007313 [Mortierella sp. NVP85]
MLSATQRALHLPEVLYLVGSFLSQNDALSCVLVSRAWLQAFRPVLWSHVETANNISPEDMVRNANYIRTLSLSDLKGLEEVLEKCTRLEALILWPDTFEDEEDEEDEYFKDQYHEESLFKTLSKSVDSMDIHKQKVEQQHFMEQTEEDRTGSSIQENEIGSDSLGEDSIQQDHEEDRTVAEKTPASLHPSAASMTITATATRVDGDQQQTESLPLEGFTGSRDQQPVFLQGPQAQLTNLLLRNPNLTRLELFVERKSPGRTFWQALAGSPPSAATSTSSTPTLASSCSPSASWSACPRLTSFQSLLNLRVYKYIDLFLQMCTRLESLELEQCSLRQLDESFYATLRFPRMKEIKFGRIRDTSLQCQLLIMKQCPELRSLEWRVPRLGFPVEDFCQAFREGSWNKLHSLMLPESRLTDEELARILSSTKAPSRMAVHHGAGHNVQGVEGLSKFEARRSDFAGESFKDLVGHFRTLTHLDLFQCLGLESWMVVEILNECPLLESFDGRRVFVQDIMHAQNARKRKRYQDSRKNNADSFDDDGDDGWVCKSIRYLEVHIAGFAGDGSKQDMEMQWEIFGQLAKLERLVYLSIGGRSSSQGNLQRLLAPSCGSSISGNMERGDGGGLEMNLRAGLGRLATLRHLRMLRFTGLEQQMTQEDVEWMITNLPELKVIQGRLHSDPGEQERLEQILDQGGVTLMTAYQHLQRSLSEADILEMVLPDITAMDEQHQSSTPDVSVFRRTPAVVENWHGFLESAIHYQPSEDQVYIKSK